MKKILITILQILLTIGIVYWVFRDPEKRAEMVQTLQNAEPSWLIGAVLAFAIILLAGLCRWWLLLRAVGIHLPVWRVGSLFMIGIFFNAFMLGSTGGDVIKMFYIFREAPDKKTSGFVSIIVDRVVGLMALILIALFFVALKFSWLTGDEVAARYVYGLIFILAGAVGGLGFVSVIAWLDLAQKLPAWIPLRAKFIEVSDALRVYGRTPMVLLQAFLLSFAGHFGMFLSFYLLAKAFGAAIAWFSFFAIMPIISVYTSLPITFGGLGVREKLFEDLLGKLAGVPADIGVLIGSAGFVVLILWALLGGVIYLFYRTSQGAPHPEELDEPIAIEKPHHG